MDMILFMSWCHKVALHTYGVIWVFCVMSLFFIFMLCPTYCDRRHNVFALFIHASVCRSVHPYTLLTQYLENSSTDLHQTYTSDALWDRDEGVTFRVQKVKVEGHGGINIYWKQQFTGGAHSTRRIPTSPGKSLIFFL